MDVAATVPQDNLQSLTRENSFIIQDRLRANEYGQELFKDLSFLLSCSSGDYSDPDMLTPSYSSDFFSAVFGERSSSLSRRPSVASIIQPKSASSHSQKLQDEDNLAIAAFRSIAPAVDLPIIHEEEVGVCLKDLELHPREEPREEDSTWTLFESQEEPLSRTASVDVDAWWRELQGDSLVAEEDSTAQDVSFELPPTPPPVYSAAPEPSPKLSAPPPVYVSAPPPNTFSAIASTSSSISTRSPSIFSEPLPDDDDEDYDDEWFPEPPSSRKRRRRSSSNYYRPTACAPPLPPKKPRTSLSAPFSSVPNSTTQLYCLYANCPFTAAFSNVRDRNRHMETHFPDRDHPKCVACGKTMSRADSVKRHQNSAAGRACKIALMGKHGATEVAKPWAVVAPWKEGELRMPPVNDPLYPLVMELKREARRRGEDW